MHTTTNRQSSQSADYEKRLEAYLHAVFEQSEILFPHEQAYILAAAATALNEHQMLRAILHTGFDYKADARSFYEVILQTYLFAGFPAALEGLAVLKTVCKELNREFTPPAALPYDLTLFNGRGEELCEQIYSTTYQKMRRNLIALSPDLADWMITEGYGKTLARQGVATSVRELAVVAVLALLGWKTQLYSHLRGAMNVGAMPLSCIDTLKMLALFAECSKEPELQPLLRKRLALANETLTMLLDDATTP